MQHYFSINRNYNIDKDIFISVLYRNIRFRINLTFLLKSYESQKIQDTEFYKVLVDDNKQNEYDNDVLILKGLSNVTTNDFQQFVYFINNIQMLNNLQTTPSIKNISLYNKFKIIRNVPFNVYLCGQDHDYTSFLNLTDIKIRDIEDKYRENVLTDDINDDGILIQIYPMNNTKNEQKLRQLLNRFKNEKHKYIGNIIYPMWCPRYPILKYSIYNRDELISDDKEFIQQKQLIMSDLDEKIFNSMNWNNMVLAGGSVSLLGIKLDPKIRHMKGYFASMNNFDVSLTFRGVHNEKNEQADIKKIIIGDCFYTTAKPYDFDFSLYMVVMRKKH